MNPRRCTAAIAASTLFLSSCLATYQPSRTIYLLHPAPSGTGETVAAKPSLAVAKPSVASGLDTERIAAFLHQRRELEYFADARWSGRLDEVLYEFLLESLEPRFAIVGSDLPGARQGVEHLLLTKIRDFQAEFNGGPQGTPLLRVGLAATLIDVRSGEVRARMLETAAARADDPSLRAIAQGLEALFRAVTDRMMEQLLQATAEAPPPSGGTARIAPRPGS